MAPFESGQATRPCCKEFVTQCTVRTVVLLISQVRVYAQVSVLGRFRYTLGCQVWWRGQLRFTPRFLVLFHSIQSCPWEPVPAATTTIAAPLLTGSSCSVSSWSRPAAAGRSRT